MGVCEQQQQQQQLEDIFREAITTGLDILMPVKSVRLNTKDAPWMTPEMVFNHEEAESFLPSGCGFYSIQVLQERRKSHKELHVQ